MPVKRIKNRKGFTLVELMIVVAIIGILAAIAIPNFLEFRLKAKSSEAKAVLGAIRHAELAYFAEWAFFVANQPLTPILDRSLRPNKEVWLTNTRFSIIGFAAEGSVFFSYALEGVDFPIGSAGYSAASESDIDGDGAVSRYRINNTNSETVKSGDDY